MACRAPLLLALVTGAWGRVYSQDEVPLVQRAAYAKLHRADAQDAEVEGVEYASGSMKALATVLDLIGVLTQDASPASIEAADQTEKPAKPQCTWAERKHMNRTLITVLTKKRLVFPQSCPKGIPALVGSNPGPCLQEWLNISDQCASCHATLLQGVATILPNCVGVVVSCPIKTNGLMLPKVCWAHISSCLKIVEPKLLGEMKCIGGFAEGHFELVRDTVAALSTGNPLSLGKLMADLTKAVGGPQQLNKLVVSLQKSVALFR